MRTLLATVTTVIGLGLMASLPVHAAPMQVVPKAAIAHTADGIESVGHRRHHRHHRHWGYAPRHYGYGTYYGYGPRYGYPRYRSYGYYGGGFPGVSLYIGPRYRWHRW